MKQTIKMVGNYNELELGYVEGNTYYQTGLLEDSDHAWKILEWIDQEIQAGYPIRVVKEREGMMEESQCKNKTALDKIVKGAFRNTEGGL